MSIWEHRLTPKEILLKWFQKPLKFFCISTENRSFLNSLPDRILKQLFSPFEIKYSDSKEWSLHVSQIIWLVSQSFIEYDVTRYQEVPSSLSTYLLQRTDVLNIVVQFISGTARCPIEGIQRRTRPLTGALKRTVAIEK